MTCEVHATSGVNYATDRYGQGEKLPTASEGQTQPNSINPQQLNTQGVGTAVQTNTDFNLYGNDIANFEKFKGNDKHDAMRITTTVANDVKRAYMQLQHEFPDAVIAFEPMPDPKTCGKKREGFFTYQQLLENWKNNALQQIANARETSTREMGDAIIQNDNRNAAFNAGVTIATGEAVMNNDNVHTEELSSQVADVENAVHAEGNTTRRTVTEEGESTRREVRSEGDDTRRPVRSEGHETREAVHDEDETPAPMGRTPGVLRTAPIGAIVVEAGRSIRELVNEVLE